MNDLALLRVEMELLWPPDDGPALVIASARDGMQVRVTSAVPESVANAARAEAESAPGGMDWREPPPLVERLRLRLEDALGAAVGLTPGSGPSYLVHEDVAFAPTAELIASDAPAVRSLRHANPGNWETEEWQQLICGRLGEWVMALANGRVVAICHTPRSNERAAEAGTWTHPDFRGRGHAAACTAAWAAVMRPSGRILFYSTSRTNRSSQAVAVRLGLRQLGCLWQLGRLA